MGTYKLPKREIKFRCFNHGEMEFYSYEDNSMWALHEIVYPEKLMQYTGLKDKNGKDVYEGDIVTVGDERDNDHLNPCYHQRNEVVVFDRGCYKVTNSYMNDGRMNYMIEGLYFVIGNVFENPELLETNKPITS